MNASLIDSPFANIANIARALRTVAAIDITRDAAAIARASKIVLPGVGSFAAAMAWLRERRIDAALRDAVANGASLLGICVGHQLLFDSSEEMGITRDSVSSKVRFASSSGALPVPRSGGIAIARPLFDGVESEAFYFVNSYAARGSRARSHPPSNGPFTAAAQHGRVRRAVPSRKIIDRGPARTEELHRMQVIPSLDRWRAASSG
jgi:glutamine amidotransferase